MSGAVRGRVRVLAVASGGGHWMQLLRLVPALKGTSLTFVSVQAVYVVDVPGHRFRVVPDATRWSKWRMMLLAVHMLWVVISERPHLVLSTGAAPGYFALLFGRMLGARTVWVDSIANAEHLSLSGEKAGRVADMWLTQWEHLATPGGPRFEGSVL